MSGINLSEQLLTILLKPDKSDLATTLEKTHDSVKESIKEAASIKDSYGNSLLSIGNDDKSSKFNDYWFSNDSLNYTLWLSLYNDSWVFRRAIDKPAQDEIRCGINLQGNIDKKDIILKEIKKHRHDLIQLLQWGALFGGSIAIMMFDGLEDEDYGKPINWSKVRSSKIMRMYVTDRWYGCSPDYNNTVAEMTSLDYGKPEYYNIIFADGHGLKVHHDYILRYEHRSAPVLIKNGQLQGWGYAEGSHILNELSRDDKLKGSIQSLVDKCLIEVVKMPGMRGLFLGTDKENEQQIQSRLEMVNWARNFNSLTFLDKDDEYSMSGFSGLTGLSELLEQNMWAISAALEMQGVLYGDLKRGFSNDVDALERYDEVINGRCESYVRPVYEKLLWVLYNKYEITESPEFTFNSLLMKKQDQDRIEGLKKFVELCSQMSVDGVIDSQQYARAVQKYSVNGIVDFGLTDDKIDSMKETIKEEMEKIDL